MSPPCSCCSACRSTRSSRACPAGRPNGWRWPPCWSSPWWCCYGSHGPGWCSHLGPRERLLMGWSGMRGAITLAIALSIPLAAADRGLLLFLAASVVLVTLVVQASTLGPLLRLLGLGEGRAAVVEEATAREALLEVAMSRQDRLDEHTADCFPATFRIAAGQGACRPRR
ncbi:cation:proton antiporter [Spongiactinospora sp. TRM90649]|uniref:cation:proton antiporter domain-containing protein n=1 Tax=Spongiactinospora sp. TRM90649 TaxID=3031114 RepID=UPI0023F6669A|nr:cation:proton antiporter [Spongiactinospora sp. TRM90649]MDF5758710.1 cation:proton antiporter [Spongiactinospora sp. TRM90649]